MGIDYQDLEEHWFGTGLGIAWGPTDFVILSIGATPNRDVLHAYLTCGVLKSVEHNRSLVLEFCNQRTHQESMSPVFLHEGENDDWDILMQQNYMVPLLASATWWFQKTLELLPQFAASAREQARQLGLQGETHNWNHEDAHALLARSVT